ncbi:cellulose biosynthesis protein BcsS [Methylobacterium haplocladii]|uniref:Cellulose biosynthesis protein BcsS n=1 Tax=Methylobacterium haplocladii TaxID=1176176 RepID=A0A512IUK9_9HYPH|nr:cellulose biosynthesis protein BcsS [Methylobacterium haplocladii]GEP01392.1 hypothetical protein MHA02_37790 [Methylobacterium haplocladii]GLS58283.1 hypothetical protein GCM10007887_09410 [Methylobacterium haplocladii]
MTRCLAGIGASSLCCLASPAFAKDDAVSTVLFGSMDTGTSVFAGGGFKAAPERVDREGFAILGMVGAGARREQAPALVNGTLPTLVRITGLAALLGGYQFFFDWGVLGLFAGPEASVETLTGNGGFGVAETRFGARLQGELWARPSENTLTTVTVVLGSARWDAYGRVSAGYRLFGAYLGPEAAAYADRTGYGRFNLGLHATDFGFGAFRFRLSAGCSYESETRRLGPYLAVAGWVPL